MQTRTVVGITIHSVDYMEKDKIITVLTIDGGKISLRARGINAPKAKLKFAGELFSLCEFECSVSKNPLLISAVPKHMFWGVRESVEKLYLACFCLEHIAETADDFKFLLACLSFLEVNEYSPEMAVKLILESVKHMGIGFSLKACVKCGSVLTNKCTFDFDRGGFLCDGCFPCDGSPLLKTLQIVNDNDVDGIAKYHFSKLQQRNMLEFLHAHIAMSYGVESKNLREIIKIENGEIM